MLQEIQLALANVANFLTILFRHVKVNFNEPVLSISVLTKNKKKKKKKKVNFNKPSGPDPDSSSSSSDAETILKKSSSSDWSEIFKGKIIKDAGFVNKPFQIDTNKSSNLKRNSKSYPWNESLEHSRTKQIHKTNLLSRIQICESKTQDLYEYTVVHSTYM